MPYTISREQMEYDLEELETFRDHITKAVEDLLAIIDSGDAFERYPGLHEAFDRVEALL